MTDLLDKAESGRNWIERIADRLPGFSGYQSRETRREVDRLFRGHLARRVDAARAALAGRIRELSRHGNLDAIAGLDGAEKGLDGLANRIRTADSGYAGFFDAVKVGEAELAAVYAFDLEFDRTVTALAATVDAVASVGGPTADELRGEVEKAEVTWRRRADLLDLAAAPSQP